MLHAQSPVIGSPFTRELHAPQARSDPFIRFFEQATIMREWRSKIVRRSAHHLIHPSDTVIVQIVGALGQFPDLILEFLHGLRTHPDGLGRDIKPQKGKAFSERCDKCNSEHG